MSKKLLIVRHAKSDWSTASISDFNRPLNERGKKNAPLMGIKLKKTGFLTACFFMYIDSFIFYVTLLGIQQHHSNHTGLKNGPLA